MAATTVDVVTKTNLRATIWLCEFPFRRSRECCFIAPSEFSSTVSPDKIASDVPCSLHPDSRLASSPPVRHGGMLAATGATAACGDHIIVLNRTGGAAPSFNSEDKQTQRPSQPPCHGPNCSGAPQRHSLPPAPFSPVGPQVKEQAQCSDAAGDPDSTRSSFCADGFSPHPIHHSASIFHPPRNR